MSRSSPCISIIVPVYNVEEYLPKCLDSLTSQTLKDIEIICVNDGSTDRSLDILKKYASHDNRIIIFDLKENIKQGGARNVGIKHARAEFLAFVDSDDFVASDMYEILYDSAIKNNADMVCSDYYLYYGDDNIHLEINCNPQLFTKSIDERNKDFILKGVRLWTNLFNKSLFVENNLFFPEKVIYEDNAIVTALYLSAKKIVKVNKSFYYYRRNNISTTRSLNDYRFFDRLETSRLFWQHMHRLGFYRPYKKEVEFRFVQLFYINTIFCAITQFIPPATKYINRIKKEMCELIPDFEENPYYKLYISWKSRFFLSLIQKNTTIGVSVYKLLLTLKK